MDRSDRVVSRRSVVMMGATAALAAGAGAHGAPRSAARFDRERFVADCRDANGEGGQAAVEEILARAVSDHAAVLAALGEPTEAGLDVLLSSPTLTIFAAAWAPQMSLVPHDHAMWALIGLYTGREDNIFWRRTNDGPPDSVPGGLEAFGADALFAGDVARLPADAIHSVTNPLPRFTGGLHIYGGDFFATQRSQWSAETLAEEPSDGETIRAMFVRENERLRRQSGL